MVRVTAACEDDFYPRPPRGGRRIRTGTRTHREKFLSTPSARRATMIDPMYFAEKSFLSTPSARRATVFLCQVVDNWQISIHALREEGDIPGVTDFSTFLIFLSTPSARRATWRENGYQHLQIFLSTPSARRATRWLIGSTATPAYFYPRPPRGGRRYKLSGDEMEHAISIHALREEGDAPCGGQLIGIGDFYPRPPRGGRLPRSCVGANSDDFYPRPPRGGRQKER